MHNDLAYHTKAHEFHGLRVIQLTLFEEQQKILHLEMPKLTKSSKFTSDPDWQFWGTGRNAW
ncbi:hypothetical protein RRF57_010940 [Xylaria bambusicola]|uniref:Uncharacterized protein n=1 Tax=Xylaria bambusicola TaxID=326684 RepID=A0AAN7ZDJ3_9PEZI